ncbi:MAG: riboflavin biosynthesis protein RibF [Planctomycetota bacterium]|nr:riboflavin biosynthesis protein RibF [Planctomycetota bacterium]
MLIHRGEGDVPAERGAAVTLGVFDGVHLGHQAVLKDLRAWAAELKAPCGALTFAQHPRRILDGRAPDMLTSLEHRLLLFERAGIEFTWVLDFTKELSRQTAAEFAERVLVGRLDIRALALGFDSRFGCDRMGTGSPELPPLAARLGFALRCLDPVLTPDGRPVSSTLVREAIQDGRLHDAEAMLGRRVSVLGTVVQGDARGRRLGYATANLDLAREVRPPFGVYATLTRVDGREHGSVTNVGYRPTVHKDLPPGQKPDLLLESHLFDFSGDLYGKTLEVSFVAKLRDERRFADVQALVEQIRMDEAKARGILKAIGY